MNERVIGGEPVADLRIRASTLKGIEVPPEIAPSMIDEYPILFIAAALAEGRTIARGLEELRVKESDRIAVMAEGLRASGVKVEELPDGLVIEGSGGGKVSGGATIRSEEHTSELQSLMRISYAVFCLKKK